MENIEWTTFTCPVCGEKYDESEGCISKGIPPHTLFESLSEDWSCPICGAKKNLFVKNI